MFICRCLYVVYGPPHNRYAWFAMLAVFRASAAEVWALLISSDNFGGFESVTFTSQAIYPIFWYWDFCTSLEWELVWSTFSSTGEFAESVGNMLNYPLQFYYQLVVLPHRISKILYNSTSPQYYTQKKHYILALCKVPRYCDILLWPEWCGLRRICFSVYGKSVACEAFPPFFDLMAPKFCYQ
jgi:hypothetical protein